MPENEFVQGVREAPVVPAALPDIVSLGIGKALRKRREQLEWTLPQVSEWLRIRQDYLQVFEEGELADSLPADVYTFGFLRTYSSALGFDPELVVACYKQERRRTGSRKPKLTFPEPPPDRRIPPRVVVSLGIAVIVGAYIGWYRFMDHAPLALEHVPSVAEIIPGEKTANATSPQVASLLPDPGTSPPPLPASPDESMAVKNEVPSSGITDEEKPQKEQPADALPDANSQQPAVADNSAETPKVSSNEVVVRADAPSWVQIKNASGQVVYDHIMQPGDVWIVPAESGPYSMATGNAGGIAISAGDVTTPHLGKDGAVLRKISLNADDVKNSVAASAHDEQKAGALPQSAADAQKSDVQAEFSDLEKKSHASDSEKQIEKSFDTMTPAASANPGRQPDVPPAGSSDDSVINANAAPDFVENNTPQVQKPPVANKEQRRKKETSADDLNARQLHHIKDH